MSRSSSSQPDLSELIRQLHSEGLRAIHAQDVALYESVIDGYRQILLAFPLAWEVYGADFDRGAAASIDSFGLGPMRNVTQVLYEEMTEAFRGGNREVSFAALAFPLHVIFDAAPLRAFALIDDMLGLLTNAFSLARQNAAPELQDVLAEKARRHVFEVIDFGFARRLTDDLAPMEDRRNAYRMTVNAFDHIQAMLHFCVVNRQIADLLAIDHSWGQLFEYWTPEFEGPRDFEIDAMVHQFGPDYPALEEARAQSAKNAELVELKKSLLHRRLAQRFALYWWALRIRREANSPESAEIVGHLLQHFPSPKQAAQGVDAALDLEWKEERHVWTDWVLSQLPEGEVHAIGVDLGLLHAFVVGLFMTVASTADPEPLEAYEWVSDRYDVLTRLVDQEAGGEPSSTLLVNPPEQETVQRIRAILASGKARWEEVRTTSIRETSIDEERVEKFVSNIQSAWRESRLVAPLLATVNGYSEESVREPPSDWFGQRDQFLPKEWFTADPRIANLDMVAVDIGRSISQGENRLYVDRLTEAVNIPTSSSDSVLSAVLKGIEALVDQGFNPSCLFIPVNWRLEEALGLPGRRLGRPEPREVLALPPEARHHYLGQIADVDVFQLTAVGEGEILIADLGRFAQWRQKLVGDGQTDLVTEVLPIDRVEAERMASQDPALLSTESAVSIDARAAELQLRVILRVREWFELSVVNQRAARRLELPADMIG